MLTAKASQTVKRRSTVIPMYKFLPRGTRITVLEGPYTGHRGRVESIVYQQPTGSEERAFCYEVTLEPGKVVNVHALSVAPGWLQDNDLAWLLERLPKLTFLREQTPG